MILPFQYDQPVVSMRSTAAAGQRSGQYHLLSKGIPLRQRPIICIDDNVCKIYRFTRYNVDHVTQTMTTLHSPLHVTRLIGTSMLESSQLLLQRRVCQIVWPSFPHCAPLLFVGISNISVIKNSSLLLTYRYGSFCSIFSSDLILSPSFIQAPKSAPMESKELIVSKDVSARQTHKIYTDLDSGRREIRLISILPGN